MLGMRRGRTGGGTTLFRVSDVVAVPLRGTLLRLRVVEGTPSLADLGPGALLDVRGPDGGQRRVQVVAHTITGGRQTQARLDRTRELDVLIADDAGDGVPPVEIGWMATGPVSES